MKKTVITPVLIGLLGTSMSASAFFFVDDEGEVQVDAETEQHEQTKTASAEPATEAADLDDLVAQVPSTGRVAQIGSGIPDDVAGFGDGLTMGTAFEMLMPSDWHTKVSDSINDNQATWEGDQNWLDALGQAAESADVRVIVDWHTQTVAAVEADEDVDALMRDVADARQSERKSEPEKADSSGTLEREEGEFDAERFDGDDIEVSSARLSDRWELEGGSLKEQLEGWADKAGYKVVWQLDNDFRVSTNATVQGDFPSAAEQVIDSIRNSGARIRAQLYEGNNVIVVRGD